MVTSGQNPETGGAGGMYLCTSTDFITLHLNLRSLIYKSTQLMLLHCILHILLRWWVGLTVLKEVIGGHTGQLGVQFHYHYYIFISIRSKKPIDY